MTDSKRVCFLWPAWGRCARPSDGDVGLCTSSARGVFLKGEGDSLAAWAVSMRHHCKFSHRSTLPRNPQFTLSIKTTSQTIMGDHGLPDVIDVHNDPFVKTSYCMCHTEDKIVYWYDIPFTKQVLLTQNLCRTLHGTSPSFPMTFPMQRLSTVLVAIWFGTGPRILAFHGQMGHPCGTWGSWPWRPQEWDGTCK